MLVRPRSATRKQGSVLGRIGGGEHWADTWLVMKQIVGGWKPLSPDSRNGARKNFGNVGALAFSWKGKGMSLELSFATHPALHRDEKLRKRVTPEVLRCDPTAHFTLVAGKTPEHDS